MNNVKHSAARFPQPGAKRQATWIVQAVVVDGNAPRRVIR